MFIEQPPQLIRLLYPDALWRMDKKVKAVYLTFDDGPIPEVTPWVLDLLDKYQIKATFFMVGDNVRKHPKEYQMVVERGHRIGNHTFNHIRGFEYLSKNYLANADKANEYLHTDLFRPPHGHMRWPQYWVLKHKYRIVMWDLVTRDVQQTAERSASIPESQAIRPERFHHHLPRFLEIGTEHEIRASTLHRMAVGTRI